MRILADRPIAATVAFLFNGYARILGTVMRKDHSVTSANVKPHRASMLGTAADDFYPRSSLPWGLMNC